MIRILAGLSILAALGFGAGTTFSTAPVYLPIAAIILAGVLALSARLPTIMSFLIGLFALSFLLLGAITAANEAGFVPDVLVPFLPPPHAALVAAALALVNYGVCFIPVVRGVIDKAAPYFEARESSELELGWFGTWRMPERWIGLGLFAVIIVLNVIQVYLTVLFNYNNNKLFTALQDKDVATFWSAILTFSIVAAIYIIRYMFEYYLTELMRVHWRRWLTKRYLDEWLGNKTHYRMALQAGPTDNPDQRISEDVRDFVANTTGFYVQIFVTSLTLYAFIQILWSISAQFPYRIGGFDLSVIPGYLVWMSLALAVIATMVSHLIGRQLVGLNFRKQKVEADFRFNLVRVRENTEQIALLNGETTETGGLMHRFAAIFRITIDLAIRQVKLGSWVNGFGQAMNVLPLVLLAPAYFTNAAMKLGSLTQTNQAFGQVMDSFSFFINFYSSIAEYKAILNRLTTFDQAIAKVEASRMQGIGVEPGKDRGALSTTDLALTLPDGRPLLDKAALVFRRGERTLVTGPSGSGKTTLFRALSGIWPFGSGRIEVPEGETVMLLPQRPYMPLGSLRAALAYPSPETAYPDDALRAALETVGLGHLDDQLDRAENWTNALSGGEQQRVAIVRALLRKPQWLFLDEATAALDEQAEAAVYEALRRALPQTTIVSIGHRSSLVALHDRRIAIETEGGTGRIADAPLQAFGTAG
ncbi:ABC transporter ATP-binding protein/permease [Labrys wisconsinensis]|uniref:ATP-binding cassette transporter n=1 Tax=Labrys wisconsinensis TaxID=425677 RepID=A0ABU0JEH2_9HYPH|nr:ABC transporter ATP-binding protein/permease [Labrys wisconsinensis]MDQ0472675.1 putative ATP-binding cassette transporter [Labrys wisconsinensis]